MNLEAAGRGADSAIELVWGRPVDADIDFSTVGCVDERRSAYAVTRDARQDAKPLPQTFGRYDAYFEEAVVG